MFDLYHCKEWHPPYDGVKHPRVFLMHRRSPTILNTVRRNPFDVTGALNFGMNAIWVDRQRKGWSDSLLPVGGRQAAEPTKIVHGLGEVYEYIASLH